jgi:TPP-dependent pyruvate/acetoin dehydrogenase alpha subunit
MLPEVSREVATTMFRKALLTRRFEEECIKLGRAEIPGHYHLAYSQEVTAAVINEAARPTDWMGATHRNHHVMLARGLDPKLLMAECLGKSTGSNHGYAGSFHINAPGLNVVPTSAMVAGMIPVATGAALASKAKGTDDVAFPFFGDGSVGEGAFYESLEVAAVHQLGVVYICENNGFLDPDMPGWRTGHTGGNRIPTAFDIPVSIVDGMDSGVLYRATSRAIDRARSGGGPSFIEVRTYPSQAGHMDTVELPEGFTNLEPAVGLRPYDAGVSWYSLHDPVSRFAQELVIGAVLSAEEVLGIDKEIMVEIAEATKFARESPLPRPEEALDRMYAPF